MIPVPYIERGAPLTTVDRPPLEPTYAAAPAWLRARVGLCDRCAHRNPACNCAGRCLHPSVLSPSLAPQCADPDAACPARLWGPVEEVLHG
jgi:hypothetical protein